MRERGSGSAAVAGVIGVLVVLMVAALALVSAARASTRARTAADLGALAGAQAALGLTGGSPCAQADRVVRANGARTLVCTVQGVEVQLVTGVPAARPGWGLARAVARAGPDETPTG